jgi:hypothetical protein
VTNETFIFAIIKAMQNEKQLSRWNPAEMLAAVEEFEQSGDYARCLNLLGATEGRNPLLVLQDALKRASNRRERDAFEDIALSCSRSEQNSRAGLPRAEDLLGRTCEIYGPYAEKFLTLEQIRGLVSGLSRLCAPPPSEECLLALLGMEIEMAVKDTVSVGRKEFGDSLTISRTDCGECGGTNGGRGKIFCTHCLAEARRKIEANEFIFQGAERPPLELLIKSLLINHTASFGCSRCGQRPVRPCSCAREITIPANPKDGQVVRGKHLATGNEKFFCIRVENA